VKLDSLQDPAASGRRRIINDAVEANKSHVDTISNYLKTQLSEASPEIQVGIYFGLVRALDNEFGKSAKETVDKMIETLPKQEALITKEEAADLSKIRTEFYSKQKTLVELAKTMGMDEGMDLPRKRTGSKGKRGPRQASYITWSIDGVEVPEAVGTLRPVVELYDQYATVGELTKAMREKKINLTEPDAEGNDLSFVLPDGKTLTGEYNPPTDEDEEDEDEDSTEEVESE
jgi:hypothetical protein